MAIQYKFLSGVLAIARQYWRSMSMLLLFVLGAVQSGYSSHAMGAEITYECLGNNQYRITLSYFRDCAGIGAAASHNLSIGSANCNVTLPNLNVTQDPANSGVEVSQLCPSQLPQSRCNGGTLPGVELYTYTAIVTLPQGCTDWRIQFQECCRNSAITNISNPGSVNIYADATISNAGGLCNNSPVFNSRPVPYICAGEEFNYNHGAFDSENDSLYYELISVRGTNGVLANYNGGFSPTQPVQTNPVGGMVFNNNTGQMTFTPAAGVAQNVVIAVQVSEIRNGDTIGRVMRDIQLVVLNNCSNQNVIPNNTPVVNVGGSYDPATNSFLVCAGTQLVFQFGVSDPDPLDTLAIDFANTNIFQVFGAGNVNIAPVYPIAGRTDTMDVFVVINTVPPGNYSFTIGITDGACPVPGTQALTFNVAIPGIEVTAQDTVVCAGIAQNIPLTSRVFVTGSGPSPGTFSWQQISGPAAPLNDPLAQNPVVQVPASTTAGQDIVYAVIFETVPDPVTGVFCSTADTVIIGLRSLPVDVDIQTLDTSLCQAGQINTVNLNTFVSAPGVDSTTGTFTWTSDPPARIGDLSNTNTPNPVGSIAGVAGDSIVYYTTFDYGACTGTDSVTLRFREGEIVFDPANPVLCAGDTIQLSATLSDTFITFLPVDCNDYAVEEITFQNFPTTGTNISLADDQLSGSLPIGFDFDFFCNTYSQFVISSNGYITFTGGGGSGCCAGQNLPNPFAPNNLIAPFWTDLNPATGGTITYATQGTAPNRQLIVSFNAVDVHFQAGTATGQIVLHEGTNIIETHITTFQTTNTFRIITNGIENADGSVAYTVPGRNATFWQQTTPSAWRFAPIEAAIFDPITYQWSPAAGLSSDTLPNPLAFSSATTMYQVTISEGACQVVDSVEVEVLSTLLPPTMSCGLAQDPNSNVRFVWQDVAGAVAWEYSLDSGRTWQLQAAGVREFTVTGLGLNDCATLYVRAVGGSGPCTRNAASILTCCTTPCNTVFDPGVPTDVSCFGGNDGSISWPVTSAGGVGAPFYYTIFNALTGQQVAPLDSSFSNNITVTLPAGTYYLTATDSVGCPGTSDTVTIIQPAALGIAQNVSPTSCFNTSDGQVSLTVTNGTAPYTFNWSNGQATALASGLAAGTYEVTVTDDNGCSSILTNIEVLSPFGGQAPVVQTSRQSATDCVNPNGQIAVTAVQNLTGNPTPPGAPGSLSYAWSTGDMDVLQITGLSGGQYELTITDANGCVYTEAFTLNASAVSVDNSVFVNPDCGLTNGSATAVGQGSTAFDYEWSDGQTTRTALSLAPGVYTVTVTSNGSCTATADFTLSGNSLALNVDAIQERICAGEDNGFVTISTSSAGAITYLWSNGQTTANATGLAAGTYTVTATSQAAGVTCSATLSAIIREPNTPFAANPELEQGLDCSGNPVARVLSRAAGGWGSYQFDWSNGATTNENQDLPEGMYVVTITDAEGCQVIDSVEVPPVLIPRLEAWIQAQGQDSAAVPQDVSVAIDAGFNQAGVSYQWIPTTNVENPTAAATNVKGEEPGTYEYVIVATAGNCSVSDTITLEVLPVGLREFPNAFTPDGDGQNDFFRPIQAQNIEVQTFQVLNRWGQVVFDNPGDYATGWDGTYNGQMQPRDVYMFVFEYRLPGQTEFETLVGEITLIR